VKPDPRLADVYPAGAADDWTRRNGCRPINHMICVRTELLDRHPWLAADLWELMLKGREAGGLPADKDRYGIEANYKALSLAESMRTSRGWCHAATTSRSCSIPPRSRYSPDRRLSMFRSFPRPADATNTLLILRRARSARLEDLMVRSAA
jgi:hypothetical protein